MKKKAQEAVKAAQDKAKSYDTHKANEDFKKYAGQASEKYQQFYR